jgi:hypothetical protein
MKSPVGAGHGTTITAAALLQGAAMTEAPLPARLDAADVQRRLAIGPRRLFQLIAEGRFPPPDLRVGKTGRRLWNLATVETWEREQGTGAARAPTGGDA